MLEFINNNGILCSGIFSLVGVVVTAFVSLIRDNMKNRADTVQSLRNELGECKKELQKTKDDLHEARCVEHAEKNIDKTHGSIYYERFSDGGSRMICGFCWEKEHIKIPVVADMYYDDDQEHYYYDGFCHSCKTHCIENLKSEVVDLDEELPF